MNWDSSLVIGWPVFTGAALSLVAHQAFVAQTSFAPLGAWLGLGIAGWVAFSIVALVGRVILRDPSSTRTVRWSVPLLILASLVGSATAATTSTVLRPSTASAVLYETFAVAVITAVLTISVAYVSTRRRDHIRVMSALTLASEETE